MALVDIPDGLKNPTDPKDPKYHDDIRKYLEDISGELHAALSIKRGTGTIRVTSRLNASDTKKAVPVWVGTYEDLVVRRARRFDPGEVRFGQSNRSKVYEETVNDKGGGIHYRDWTTELPEKTENGYGPGQAYGPREGFMYQLFIAIRITKDGKPQNIGTITVGFKNKPDRTKVDPIITHWATKGHYVEYLQKRFNLGGPIFK